MRLLKIVKASDTSIEYDNIIMSLYNSLQDKNYFGLKGIIESDISGVGEHYLWIKTNDERILNRFKSKDDYLVIDVFIVKDDDSLNITVSDSYEWVEYFREELKNVSDMKYSEILRWVENIFKSLIDFKGKISSKNYVFGKFKRTAISESEFKDKFKKYYPFLIQSLETVFKIQDSKFKGERLEIKADYKKYSLTINIDYKKAIITVSDGKKSGRLEVSIRGNEDKFKPSDAVAQIIKSELDNKIKEVF